MAPDVIVLRHASSGAPHFIADHVDAAVINAGDGTHEHPTQALLDCATIRKHKGRGGSIAGLTVAIVGDIAHSRVARSDVLALTRLGARVRVAGPRTMLPMGIEEMGAEVFDRVEPAVADADVVMMLRIQLERLGGAGLFPNTREYSRYFGLGPRLAATLKPDAIVMHPGPINRGVEIGSGGRRRRALGHPRPGDLRRRRAHGHPLLVRRRLVGRGLIALLAVGVLRLAIAEPGVRVIRECRDERGHDDEQDDGGHSSSSIMRVEAPRSLTTAGRSTSTVRSPAGA